MKLSVLATGFIRAALFAALFLYCRSMPASAQEDKRKAREWVKNNLPVLQLTETDFNNLSVSNTHTDRLSGAVIVNLQQQYKGLNIYHALFTIAFKEGKVLSASNTFVRKVQTKAGTEVPVVSPADAVYTTARHLKIPSVYAVKQKRVIEAGKSIEFARNGMSKNDIPVDLVWVALGDSILKLAWQVHLDPLGTSDMWNVRIDALSGAVLQKDNWTVYCTLDKPHGRHNMIHTSGVLRNKKSGVPKITPYAGKSADALPLTQSSSYLVVPYPFESPVHLGGMQTLAHNPWLSAGANNASVTNGWHNDGTTDYAFTRGNNVFAQEDLDGTNDTPGAVAGSSTPFPNLNFSFALNPSLQPGSSANRQAAITNLFYWNNIMHDISYQYGFDEAAGNFQNDNLGRGGAAHDFVFADVQDGGSFNNANFSTPPDGLNGRMQMYLFDPAVKFSINSPGNLAGDIEFAEGDLSPFNKLTDIGIKTGNLVLYTDTALTHFGCDNAFNAAALQGNIALIDRGNCDFTNKIKNAQAAGAIAAVVVNNVAGAVITMIGEDTSITIPAVMIGLADGNRLKTALQTEAVNISLSATPYFDGDLDNTIISHEYTHGISSRLTGGGSNTTCLSNAEQMGEGWSDYYALMVTTDWASAGLTDGNISRSIGNYAMGSGINGPGIRRYPYSTDMNVNPWTYGMLATSTSGDRSHLIGEIWCATLWDMTWDIINKDGAVNANLYNADAAGGNTAALKMVTLGLKLQPCGPGFLDGRDAILKADTILYNGRYSCVIWKAFARRGMGANAIQGSSDNITDQVQNFSIPAGAILRKIANKDVAAQGENINYTFNVACQCLALSGLTIRDTLPEEVTYQSGGTLNGREVSFPSIHLGEQESASYNLNVKVNNGTYSPPIVHLMEPFPTVPDRAVWKDSVAAGPLQWSVANTRFHSADFALHAPDSAVQTDFRITTVHAYPLTGLSTLSFWHYFDTELNWDGGVVELSTDSGLTWIDAGPYMTSNEYPTNILSRAISNIAGRRAFTGSSPGFIKTVIDLSSFAGRSVRIQFRFCSDDLLGQDGWYIDDVELKSESGIRNTGYLYNGTSLISTSSANLVISNALPVALTSFSVAKRDERAVLNWSTSSEFNAQTFEVERSPDGVSYQVIGSVKAAGNSNSSSSYQYSDGQPFAGTNYYRLRQVDIDGQFSYSSVRSLVFGEGLPEISLNPNPSTGLINIFLPATMDNTSLRVFDSKGVLVYNSILRPGTQTLNLSALARGSYILHFNSKNKIVNKKLVLR